MYKRVWFFANILAFFVSGCGDDKAAVNMVTERCNGADDNGNGQVDENALAGDPDAGTWKAVTTGLAIKDYFHFIAENDIYAVSRADSNIYHWDGASWSAVTSGGKVVRGFQFKSASDIIAVRDDLTIARWDGSAWQTLANQTEKWAYYASAEEAATIGANGTRLYTNPSSWRELACNPLMQGSQKLNGTSAVTITLSTSFFQHTSWPAVYVYFDAQLGRKGVFRLSMQPVTQVGFGATVACEFVRAFDETQFYADYFEAAADSELYYIEPNDRRIYRAGLTGTLPKARTTTLEGLSFFARACNGAGTYAVGASGDVMRYE